MVLMPHYNLSKRQDDIRGVQLQQCFPDQPFIEGRIHKDQGESLLFFFEFFRRIQYIRGNKTSLAFKAEISEVPFDAALGPRSAVHKSGGKSAPA